MRVEESRNRSQKEEQKECKRKSRYSGEQLEEGTKRRRSRRSNSVYE